MTKNRQRKMIYEAIRLNERFPDLPDIDVLEHIEYVFSVHRIDPDSILGYAVLLAYHTQNEHRALDFLRIPSASA
jgi:hypothetical protein